MTISDTLPTRSEIAAGQTLNSGEESELNLTTIMPQMKKDFAELDAYIASEKKKYAKGDFPTAKDSAFPPRWIRKEGENFRSDKVWGEEIDDLVNRPNITPGARRMAEFLGRHDQALSDLYHPMPITESFTGSNISGIGSKHLDLMGKALDSNYSKNPKRSERLVSAAARAELCGFGSGVAAYPLLYIPAAGPYLYGAAVLGSAGTCAVYAYNNADVPENYYAEKRKLLEKGGVVSDLERLYGAKKR